MSVPTVGLYSLPVELLYELELFALSDSLPLVSRHLNDVYKHASPSFLARYVLGRVVTSDYFTQAEVYTRALRYPICDQRVLEALRPLIKDFELTKASIQLPRRLFRCLSPPPSGWTAEHHPIPLLRYLYDTLKTHAINTNANDGYALTRAVHARFMPLVEFLLQHDASPKYREGLAVKVAIRQKDLEMVKTLVERTVMKQKKGKRQKIEDRLDLDSNMLKIAVLSRAKDIVEYLYREKNVLPDVPTLKIMSMILSR